MKKTFLKLFISLSFILFMSFPIGINTGLAENYQTDEQVNMKVYENVVPSVVSIDADLSDGISSGTGVVIDPKGLILTSSHVIEGSDEIKVMVNGGKEYNGKVLSVVDAGDDLALIRINPDKPLTVARLGDSSKVKVGQKVLAIGNPFGFNGTLTTGIISRIDNERNKLQTDAAINPGCSGGPILNTSGEVIGISQSIYNPDNNRSNIGIGFAVPVNSAKQFIKAAKTQQIMSK
ncbi:MAG: trypsin-like peptidase domain-containing protein [bacterium]